MRFVHSLSTRPISILLYESNSLERLLGSVWYYALSLAYLKKFDLTVVLYTDTLGKALLGHLPYDEIHLVDDLLPEELHPRFWASVKIYALEQEPIESIHIDGDVFIKSRELLEKIESSEWDVIVLSHENADWYEANAPIYWKDVEYCTLLGLHLGELGGYNTGILGFRDEKLKKTFINRYKAIALHFSKICRKELDTEAYMTPDLCAELKNIYQLIKDTNSTVCLIFNIGDPKKIGYQHVLTVLKFKFLDTCAKILEKISPEIYEKTYKLCHSILNKLKLNKMERK